MATESEARSILSQLHTDARVKAHLSQVRFGRGCRGGWRVRAYHSVLKRALWICSVDEWQSVREMWQACDAWQGDDNILHHTQNNPIILQLITIRRH